MEIPRANALGTNIRFFGSQSRLRDSKPRNNALHAFCGIETIELPLRSNHKKSLFEPRPVPSHQHYGKAFIMSLPCIFLSYRIFIIKGLNQTT